MSMYTYIYVCMFSMLSEYLHIYIYIFILHVVPMHVRPASLQGIPVMRAWKSCTSGTAHGVEKPVPRTI